MVNKYFHVGLLLSSKSGMFRCKLFTTICPLDRLSIGKLKFKKKLLTLFDKFNITVLDSFVKKRLIVKSRDDRSDLEMFSCR